MLLQGGRTRNLLFWPVAESAVLLRVLRHLLAIGKDKLVQMQKWPPVLGAIANYCDFIARLDRISPPARPG
jgi:hypothetical protein